MVDIKSNGGAQQPGSSNLFAGVKKKLNSHVDKSGFYAFCHDWRVYWNQEFYRKRADINKTHNDVNY